MDGAPTRPAVLAVDGGNSKTDIALIGSDGSVLAAVRVGTSSHQAVGLEAGMAVLVAGVREAARNAGQPDDAEGRRARLGVFCLAGDDLPSDHRLLGRALAAAHLADELVLRSDAFAGLWAGTTEGWGVSIVCGAGTNAVGQAPDGRVVTFPALGEISGDWGGGGSLGREALWNAVRARDGRGPRTALERLVPGHFGLVRPSSVTSAIYGGRLAEHRLDELAPLVFEASAAGDAVARGIVDRLAAEIALLAVATIRRLHLVRHSVEVILVGSVFQGGDPAFLPAIEERVGAATPLAVIRRLEAPPVLGPALQGARMLGLGPSAERRIRAELCDDDPRRSAGVG